jgi:hypothetical protein
METAANLNIRGDFQVPLQQAKVHLGAVNTTIITGKPFL